MNMLENMCYKITKTLKSKLTTIPDENFEIINYGLYVFFADITKQIIILSIAYFLGIFKYVITTLCVFGGIRSFAGGTHAKTWSGCLIVNTLVLYSITYISIYLSNISPTILALTVLPICSYIFYLYVPSDHENKPVISKKQIKQLRIISFSLLILTAVFGIFILPAPYSNIFLLAPLANSITMLPFAYKIAKCTRGRDIQKNVA